MFKILRNVNKKLLFLSIFLFVCGLVMIYSASNVTSFMLYDASPSKYFLRQAFFFGVGLVACCFLLLFPVKKYRFWSNVLLVLDSVFILALVFYGTVINGTTGWLGYGGYGVQPSEFIKVIAIVFLAMYYEKYAAFSSDYVKMLLPVGILCLVGIFIVLQGDLGTAVIFFALIFIMFFMSCASRKIKWRTFLCGVGVLVLGVLLIVVFKDKILPMSKLERFNYFHPCQDYLGNGLQLCNGYIAMNGGGITGKGFGNSTQKYLYLPEAYTDFIFPIIIEELGIVGGICLLILYFILLAMILLVGNKSKKTSYKMICYGVCVYLFLHIFVNLGGVLGIIPMTGVPLPFMSYGGSFCLSLMGAITLVLRVSYEQKVYKN